MFNIKLKIIKQAKYNNNKKQQVVTDIQDVKQSIDSDSDD